MAFKPKSAQREGGSGNFDETRNYPTPRAGSRKARVSLIVDLGEQNREDFEDPNTKELKPQKPCQQVAVFADLVNDVVDYGGSIGEAQYRLLLNKSFQGKVQGINFTTTPPKDAKGNTIQGKPWGLHPANLLTKLAKAVGMPEVAVDDRNNPKSLDISLLLNQPFMAQVEVKITEDKNGKKDKDGNVTEYKNVNFKGAFEVAPEEDDDGNEVPAKVAKLRQAPRCITFDTATVDDIQFIRGNLLAMIKQANNYAGSAMQKAIEAFEAQKAAAGDNGNDEQEQEEEQEEAPAQKPVAKKTATAKKKATPVPTDDMDDSDVPF